jgi:hypothetical protein
MTLTSASYCRHVQQDSAYSFSVRQDSDISTQGTEPVYVIDMSEEQINREDIRRRHVQQDSACSFSVRQDSDISTQGTEPVYVIDMSFGRGQVGDQVTG